MKAADMVRKPWNIFLFQKENWSLQCADERHCLTKEDILRFETDQMHSYINEGTGKVSFLCVFVDQH